MLKEKLQEELDRFNAINKYAKKMIVEQDAPPPPPPMGDVPPPPGGEMAPPPPGGDVPPPPPGEGDMGGEETEEIDITDLVNMTKNIKKEIDDNKQDNTSVLNKMEDVFTKLSDLETKLQNMDSIIDRIDSLSSEVKNMKPDTPQEKLEMRSLDSYPFNQKPNEFFSKKQEEMKLSGKNEYVLTKNDIDDFTKETIRNTFNPNAEENEVRY